MKWREGKIDGVILRPIAKHSDPRGWLAEFFRCDEIPSEMTPAMSYVSVTHPGVTRGPHEHLEQADMFGFVGPGDFRIKLWDNRPQSPTYGKVMTEVVGEKNPMIVVVPPRIVHGYTNISKADAWVFNAPNRLYRGKGKKGDVDEVRHENVENCEFVM